MLCDATHVWHASICSGCEAHGRGREHVGCFHAAGQWLEAVRHILNIALQLQESCCRHMGCPHAIWTTCRPSGLEDAGWACGAGDRSATCISLWQCTIMSISVFDIIETCRASSWGSWAWRMPRCCDTCVARLDLQWLRGIWARPRARRLLPCSWAMAGGCQAHPEHCPPAAGIVLRVRSSPVICFLRGRSSLSLGMVLHVPLLYAPMLISYTLPSLYSCTLAVDSSPPTPLKHAWYYSGGDAFLLAKRARERE